MHGCGSPLAQRPSSSGAGGPSVFRETPLSAEETPVESIDDLMRENAALRQQVSELSHRVERLERHDSGGGD